MNLKSTVCLFVLGLYLSSSMAAQEEVEEPAAEPSRFRPQLTHQIGRATSEIEIDGLLDEPAWSDATEIEVALEYFPGDNVPPPVETRAYMTYDDRNIYVGFKCFDPNPQQIRAHLMKRDEIFTFVQDDHITIMLDTFNDERRAFQFRVNPLGVQADAIFSEVDGIEDFAWDMIWTSKSSIDAEGWVAEIAFPVNQLRFQRTLEGQTWGVEFGRSWPRSSRHRITNVGRDRNRACIICQFDKAEGFKNLSPGKNLEINPTLVGSRTDELDEFPDGSLEPTDEDAEVGLTVRWGLTPNLTLTGTVNPDFSQVEADAAQLGINRRFALFFEEKRPFFLEGIDFFSTPINAVYTRTVVAPDWGGKITGKVGKNAIGAFAAGDTVTPLLFPSNQGSTSTLLEESNTSGVFRYRRDVLKTSTVGVIYAGREGDDYHNRVGGIDGLVRLGAKDTVTFQYLYSDTLYPQEVAEEFDQPEESFSGDSILLQYDHDSRKWFWQLEYDDRDPGLRLDSGFRPRVDSREVEGTLIRKFWGTEETWYDQWRIGGTAERTEDYEGQLTDEEFSLIVDARGPLQSFMQVGLERQSLLNQGVFYEDLDSAFVYGEFQPSGALKFEFFGNAGDGVDFTNNQSADELVLNPNLEAKIGRHINLELDHLLQQLDVEGGRLFQANLSQLRLVYNFNVRTFVRGIFQYLDLDRNPELYLQPVEPEVKTLFMQLLFSYQVNARTVLFAGYTDDQLGLQDVGLTQTNRTFFLKIGYAWIL